ncbi:hypothetical protein NONI108955_25400 [Nocardia ninae]
MQVPPVDDQHVFESAGDEQLSVRSESEVAGAQISATTIGQRRLENILVGGDTVEVPRRDRTAGNPDLTFGPNWALATCLWIDDDHGCAGHRYTDPDDLLACAATVRGCKRQQCRLLPQGDGADDQRRLGEAIHRLKGSAVESGRREGISEPAHGRRPNRLGAAEGEAPVGKVERLDHILRYPPGGDLVGEVGAAAVGCLEVRDRFDPALGALDEMQRGEQDCGAARVQGTQHWADQAHVVIHGQPADRHRVAAISGVAHRQRDGRLIVQQIPVGDNHTLGRRRRSRGVLQERDRLGRQLGNTVLRGIRVRDRVGGHCPRPQLDIAERSARGLQDILDRVGGEDD